MTSSALTATCPSTEIGMLVLQRYAALAYFVKLLHRDKCELRAAVLRLLVKSTSTPDFLTGFSRSQHLVQNGFIRPETSPLQH